MNWSNIFEIKSTNNDVSKYMVICKDKTKKLLIVSNIFLYDEFKSKAILADLVHSGTNLDMNVPIEVAAFRDDLGAYALYTWVDGDCAETVLKGLPMPIQVKLGVKAGKVLWQLHTVKAPETVTFQEDFFAEEIKRNKLIYTSAPLNVPGENPLIDYLEVSLPLISNRPCTVIHGNFNASNIIAKNDKVGFISPQHLAYGDPLEDFGRMFYTDNVPFKRGLLMGYFDNEDMGNRPSSTQLRLIAFYTAFELFSMMTKAVSGSVEDSVEVKHIAEKVLQSYDNFNSCIPSWY